LAIEIKVGLEAERGAFPRRGWCRGVSLEDLSLLECRMFVVRGKETDGR
jgi:hypothetical protein